MTDIAPADRPDKELTMKIHPSVHAAIAVERQAALLAEARASSLVRQARRAHRTSLTRTRPLTAGTRRVARRMLLTTFGGTETIDLTVPARDVFDLVIDVTRLPEWNARIHHVIEQPGHPLSAGDQWVVQMRAMGRRWPTRARAIVVDPVALRFEHRSCTDDGNPSHAYWSWRVIDRHGGSTLTVTWDVYPRSFWRQVLLARLRRPVLAREVRASLVEIDDACDAHADAEPAMLMAIAAQGRPARVTEGATP